MFGGRLETTNLADNDIWEWNGTSWTNKTPTSGPAPSKRQSRTLAYDANRRRVILWGGFDGAYRNDTWEWDGTKWTSLSPVTGAPPARSQHAIINDDIRGGVLVFAGTGSPGSTQRKDTWVFRYRSVPEETCRFGIDADHDGANGCADPDCWGYCTPLCPPGTQCGAGTPRCGDAVCSSLENCRLCPGDCGACTAVCGDSFCDSPETAGSCPGDCF